MATDLSGDAAGVSDFAHLHLHTQYSLLDGAIRTKDLCRVVRERGMKSVAVTDHGNPSLTRYRRVIVDVSR